MKRWLAAAAAALIAVLATAAPATAETVTIRKVDTTGFPKVKVSLLVGGEAPTLDKFVVRENGRIVQGVQVTSVGDTAQPVGVVLVIDTSGSMRQNDKLAAAKAAAIQFVEAKLANEQIAVVAFSDQPRVVLNFTSDTGLLRDAIGGLVASGETALWDGIRIGASLFTDAPGLQPNLVVLSDGKDTVSTQGADVARATVASSNAVVFAIGLAGGRDFDEGGLRQTATDSNGQYVGTSEPGALAGLFASVHDALQNQYELTYDSTATSGAISVSLTVSGVEAVASAAVGTVSEGKNATPEPVKTPSKFFASSAVLWLVVLLVLAAVGLLAWGIGLLVARERSELSVALRPYSDGVDDPDARDEGSSRDHSLASSMVMRRAVDATAKLAASRGALDWAEKKLEQAHIPLRPAEALFFNGAMAAVMVLLGFVLQGLFGAFLALVAFGALPAMVLATMAKRRQKKFTAQLPDMLQLLSSSLRSGYSLLQGLDAVAQEVQEPMASELGRVLVEAKLGRPLEVALEECSDRMGSADFEWAVMAVRIQRDVGGNLAELLETVGETMTARERLRREVSALTAEGRISAIVLGAMPVMLGIVMYAINPGYMGTLFTDPVGQAMLAASVVLALFGFWWMKKTIEIEV